MVLSSLDLHGRDTALSSMSGERPILELDREVDGDAANDTILADGCAYNVSTPESTLAGRLPRLSFESRSKTGRVTQRRTEGNGEPLTGVATALSVMLRKVQAVALCCGIHGALKHLVSQGQEGDVNVASGLWLLWNVAILA